MPERKDLIDIFKAETEEHLTKLDNGLIALEKQPDQPELVSNLNREVHTLKGAARVFGFSEIQDIAHRIEDIFEGIAGKKAVFNSFMAERIFKGLDAIRAILERIVQEKEIDLDTAGLCRELEACLAEMQGVGTQEKRGRGQKQKRGKNNKGPEGKAPEVEKTQGQASAPVHEGAVVPPPSAQREEYIRVPLSRADKLLYLVGELVINKMKSSAKVAQAKRLSKLSKETQRSISLLSETIKREFSSQPGDVIRLLSQCDAQIQKLREHSLTLYDDVSAETFHLDPMIDELQARVKEIKMMPLSTILEGFPRMVRDIASERGKEVQWQISGEETELDKKVLDRIKTSLIHILRNCIDHGIEETEARVTSGKPRVGTIKVSALQKADNVVITIEDDGRGMDIAEIKQTALKKELVTNHDLERKTDKEILNLVFMSGFSTSPVVTDVSGRGMGLDIVSRDITDLKGQVILDTQKGRGTQFTLVLPLTIAVIHVLLVEAQNMMFALPMFSIIEGVRVDRDRVPSIEGRMAIPWREHIVPLVRLNEVLNLPPSREENGKTGKEMSVVIAASFDSHVGFIVDDIVGEEEVFIKGLGMHLGKMKNVSGAVIMPTGEVVVVLDIADLIAHSAFSTPQGRGKQRPPRLDRNEKRILIVEDAFSTREMEKNILETHGYQVETAVDGLDALDKMGDTPYDLIVSDIEMPRMNGFDLCRALKKKEGTRDIPFVMVTALEKEEDKRRGMEVGAAAYIVKSAFEQTNLLDTIEQLVG
jgi:two-component system, chemotaxis family, sensor kinase CheA